MYCNICIKWTLWNKCNPTGHVCVSTIKLQYIKKHSQQENDSQNRIKQEANFIVFYFFLFGHIIRSHISQTMSCIYARVTTANEIIMSCIQY